jgi:hypothetical protein
MLSISVAEKSEKSDLRLKDLTMITTQDSMAGVLFVAGHREKDLAKENGILKQRKQ